MGSAPDFVKKDKKPSVLASVIGEVGIVNF